MTAMLFLLWLELLYLALSVGILLFLCHAIFAGISGSYRAQQYFLSHHEHRISKIAVPTNERIYDFMSRLGRRPRQ